MPLCQICMEKEATVYLTQIVNGQKTNLYVCKDCAGINVVKLDLNKLLTGLISIQQETSQPSDNSVKCDRCGMTASDFNNTGRMGCSRCYEVFFEPMKVLLTRIHGNAVHRGKIPAKAELQKAYQNEIQQLRHELQACINTENYERAAEIRDRIKYLDSLKGGANRE
jgi:protein arginine kinase activator